MTGTNPSIPVTANPGTALDSGADSGVGGVVVGCGFVAGGVVDLGLVVGGPFITVDVVDPGGQVIACIAVTDTPTSTPGTGDGVDGLLEQFGVAAGVEHGGRVQPGQPVGSGTELGQRFALPVTASTFTSLDSGITVVHAVTVDRRTTTPTTPTPASLPVNPNPGGGLEKLINVELDVSVELGRTRVTLAEVLDYDVGSIVELDRAAGAPVDIRVNDTLLAKGEVVLIDDEYAVRITAIIEPHQT